MRLVNTHTIEFEEFEGQNVPSYAILSHRWEEEEILFKDMERGTAVAKKGWRKITKCCEQARHDGLKYVWIDTCCIDKSSSAELSEAINSMFRWYQHSKICYVYLHDVHLANSVWSEWENLCPIVDKWSKIPESDREKLMEFSFKFSEFGRSLDFPVEFVTEFSNSVWFTRGWTLQELLASESLVFFGHQWQMLGTKDFLLGLITHVTFIRISNLLHERPLHDVPIAERMSWAAKRETTRIEDRAYSLMGILGVNMSLLYGEGENAFRRLQEEVMKRSTDESVLLSESPEVNLLATSPADFGIHLPEAAIVSTDRFYPFQGFNSDSNFEYRVEHNGAFALTNAGMSAALYLVPWYPDIYLVPLGVSRQLKFDPSISETAHIFLRPHPLDTRLYRIRFRGEAITYLESSTSGAHVLRAFPRLRGKPPLKRRCTIAYEGGSSLRSVSDSRLDGICFHFDYNAYWGPDGVLQSSNVIAYQKWCPTEPKLEFQAGSWGVLAIFRVVNTPGKPIYILAGFDRELKACIARAEWYHYETFDEVHRAGVGSEQALALLHGMKFNESPEHRDDWNQFVFKGSQTLDSSMIYNAAVPGIRLTITRRTNDCLVEFKNDERMAKTTRGFFGSWPSLLG